MNLDLVNLELGPGEPGPGEPGIWNLDLVNLEPGPGEPGLGPGPGPGPEPGIWNLDLVNLEPGPGEPGPGETGIWNLDQVNLETGPGEPRIWNLGSLETRTWASPPFQGLRTWDLESGALSPEPAAWREPGAWGKKSHLNRLQEVSWDLLPLGNQGGLQGEPRKLADVSTSSGAGTQSGTQPG